MLYLLFFHRIIVSKIANIQSKITKIIIGKFGRAVANTEIEILQEACNIIERRMLPFVALYTNEYSTDKGITSNRY